MSEILAHVRIRGEIVGLNPVCAGGDSGGFGCSESSGRALLQALKQEVVWKVLRWRSCAKHLGSASLAEE